jgi:hypothetical protein
LKRNNGNKEPLSSAGRAATLLFLLLGKYAATVPFRRRKLNSIG